MKLNQKFYSLKLYIFCLIELILIVLSCHAFASSKIITDLEQKKEIFNSRPKYWKEEIPQATIGIIPYRIKDQNVEILLGREVKDESWSDFGGKYDKTDNSFIYALKREYNEETGGDFLDEATLLDKSLIFYLDKAKKREVIYVFYRVEDGIKFNKNYEKSEAKFFELLKINSSTYSENFRKFFKDDLLNSEKLEAIAKLLEN